MKYASPHETLLAECIRVGSLSKSGIVVAILAIAFAGGCDVDPAVASSLIDAIAGLVNVVLQLGLLHFVV